MATFDVQVLSILSTSEDETKPAFHAVGTINDVPFVAQTILWGPKDSKEPIFKVVEGESVAQALSTSEFTRGQRIAIARACKMVRLGEAELHDPNAVAEEASEADAS